MDHAFSLFMNKSGLKRFPSLDRRARLTLNQGCKQTTKVSFILLIVVSDDYMSVYTCINLHSRLRITNRRGDGTKTPTLVFVYQWASFKRDTSPLRHQRKDIPHFLPKPLVRRHIICLVLLTLWMVFSVRAYIDLHVNEHAMRTTVSFRSS